MGPIFSSDLRSRAKRRWTKSKIDLFPMHELTYYKIKMAKRPHEINGKMKYSK